MFYKVAGKVGMYGLMVSLCGKFCAFAVVVMYCAAWNASVDYG